MSRAKKDGNGSSIMDEILPAPHGGRPAFDMTKSEAAKRLVEMAEKGTKKEKKQGMTRLVIRPLNIQSLVAGIIGTSALIQHHYSEKQIRDMINQQTQDRDLIAGTKRQKRDPEAEFKAAMHLDEKGQNAVPCYALKACLMTAVKSLPGNESGRVLSKARAGGMMQVMGNYAPLIAPKPEMRTDIARIGMKKVPWPVFRPEFWPWACVFQINFNADVVTDQDLVNLINLAGFCAGMHEWRPEKGGTFGMFRVASLEEIEKFAKKINFKFEMPGR